MLQENTAIAMSIIRRSSAKQGARRTNQSIRLTRQKPKPKFQNGIVSCIFLVLAMLVYSHFAKIELTMQEFKASTTKAPNNELGSLQNCSVTFVPPPARPESEWRRPLWIPSYPASGSASPSKQGDVVKDLIDRLFGKSGAVKNYHSSVKNRLRRCKGLSETVACSQGHPYVPVGPEKQTGNFQRYVVFVIRNFQQAFPASYTDKAIAYHGNKGQAAENGWRNVRDQYLEGAMKEWENMVSWWINADYYQVALFLPYEKLLDREKGPGLVEHLRDTLQAAGFEVAPDIDIPCIWYQVAKKERARQKTLEEYVPGYTRAQQGFMLTELTEFIQKLSKDRGNDQLVSILNEYRDDIERNTRLDIPWANNSLA